MLVNTMEIFNHLYYFEDLLAREIAGVLAMIKRLAPDRNENMEKKPKEVMIKTHMISVISGVDIILSTAESLADTSGTERFS